MRISDRFINERWYPGELNETIEKIVVLSDGAAAWAMTPPGGSDGSFTEIRGTDRAGHPADQFSDDHTDVIGSSLRVRGGKTITWKYADHTSGTQTLARSVISRAGSWIRRRRARFETLADPALRRKAGACTARIDGGH